MKPITSVERPNAFSMRIDPKIRYVGDLLARHEQRTLASLIEYTLKSYGLKTEIASTSEEVAPGEYSRRPITAWEVADATWDPNEADRLVNLAQKFPNLLGDVERMQWRTIKDSPGFWRTIAQPFDFREIVMPLVRAHWGLIQQIATGKEKIDVLDRALAKENKHG